MSLFSRALVASAVAVAAFAPAASAAPTVVCRELTDDGRQLVIACVVADARESGLTVAPYVWFGCAIAEKGGCRTIMTGAPLVDVGMTGFEPNPAFTPPTVDVATLSVRIHAGTIGTLWVDGTAYPLNVDEYCFGDPSYC